MPNNGISDDRSSGNQEFSGSKIKVDWGKLFLTYVIVCVCILLGCIFNYSSCNVIVGSLDCIL